MYEVVFYLPLNICQNDVYPLSPQGSNHFSPKRFSGLDDREREIAALREDLQAAKDEGAASKEVIAVLRKQVEAHQKERETM